MNFLRSAIAITRMEAGLFKRFPKLRVSVVGIIFIPALYAFIYLSSVWDPASRTGALPASIVNLDQGLDYRGQQVNLGRDLTATLQGKHAFDFALVNDEQAARKGVREGRASFALIIPRDFSANAVPGNESGGGKLIVYASEGNNYTGAGLARHFASELGHQVNETLNEKRWQLVLGATEGSRQSVTRLRDGIAQLRTGAHALDNGIGQATQGTAQLSTGTAKLADALTKASDGLKQAGAGIRTMDAKKPAAQDLQTLKGGAAQLAAGEVEFGKALVELESGAQRLTSGAAKMRDETEDIPIVGTRIAAGAGQLADGGAQLATALQTARGAHGKLADGASKLATGVAALTDGISALSAGIGQLAAQMPSDAKLDELKAGGSALASGAQALQGGTEKLRDGSRRLAAGLDLLAESLPANIEGLTGSARGLASSVAPDVEMDAPVPNNGTGFAPNFVPVSLWLGAVMTAFIFHLRRLPEAARDASPIAQLLGKLGLLAAIVLVQAAVVLAMLAFALDIRIANWPGLVLTMALASITFLLIILALTRAFGDTGKAVALILLIVQLSSAGGILPIELSGAFFRDVSPFLPFTWVVRGFRASMFGAYDSAWISAWLVVFGTATVAFIAATFAGQWKFVGPEEHRPAMDI